MSVYRLRHPVHGTKIAICEQEVAQDARHGWVLDIPAVSPPIENALRRRGRPRKVEVPHDDGR